MPGSVQEGQFIDVDIQTRDIKQCKIKFEVEGDSAILFTWRVEVMLVMLKLPITLRSKLTMVLDRAIQLLRTLPKEEFILRIEFPECQATFGLRNIFFLIYRANG